MPSAAVSARAATASSAERPSASEISGPTGRPITSDCPMSPCSAAPAQRQNCVHSGSFRPRRASMAATCSGEAKCPAMV
ncbi:Uncharacterised protein [Bordetella pertussis]|nr:Uncharacterised protein [Bordetella pertussis]